jgi:RND family efflux transporter MFP subunit
MTETSVESPEKNLQPGPARSTPAQGGGQLVKWFAVLFLVFAVLGLYSFAQRKTSHQVLAQQTVRMAVPYVALIHATPISGESELVLPGDVQSYVDSPIYARTNGYLKKWYKDIGSHVAKGDLLAEIDTPEIDEQLSQARADLATSQANGDLAGITAKRYQDLLKSEAVSKQDVDNYNGDYTAKQAMVQSAAANVKRLQDLESFKRVYAPFSGVITRRNVDIGTLINAGNGGNSTKEMFDLAQTDPLRVYVSVPQTYAPSIHADLKACLELPEFPGRDFCGKVVRTAGAVDPTTRTLLTEVDVPNPSNALLQGEYAEVHFDTKLSGERLTVPNNALLFRPGGTMVAVVGSNNHVELRKLNIGRDLGTSVEVLGGISPNDALVINPADSLEQDDEVRITPTTPNSEPH